MTDQELKDLVASLAIESQKTSRQIAETDRQIAELGKQMAEQSRKTDRQIKKVGKQIGDLGNKFGTFTEGMAWPSMNKILRERFGLNDVSPRRTFSRGSEALEIDVFGYDNTGQRKEIYVVEVKSRLDIGDLDQLRTNIAKLPRFFLPAHDSRIYGIIAAVDIPKEMVVEVRNAGFYLAHINDEIFKLQVPRNFKPQAFGPTAKKNGHHNGHANGKPKKKK